MYFVCREQIVLVTDNGEGVGRIFRLCPFLGPQRILTRTNLHNAQLKKSCILQNKTIIRPLRHILRIFYFFYYIPLWDPMGSGLDQKCTCTTRPWGQQHETINGSLRYLVIEEIEEQDIVYGQTDGRTKGYHISSTGL